LSVNILAKTFHKIDPWSALWQSKSASFDIRPPEVVDFSHESAVEALDLFDFLLNLVGILIVFLLDGVPAVRLKSYEIFDWQRNF
jgi:hypothetical protein